MINKTKTIFQRPILFFLLRGLINLCCFICRWHVVNNKPTEKKYVTLFGTHTTAWDFIIMMITSIKHQQPIFWVGKNSLFYKKIPRTLFRLCGGFCSNDCKEGLVKASVDLLNQNDECVIGLAPKGTRKNTNEWKTGFYHIAKNANVPVAVAFIDYKNRRSGIKAIITLTDNIDADIEKIKAILEQSKYEC